METQQFLNIVLGTAMTVIGWFARELWAAVKELKTDLAKLREDLPKEYVLRDDYRDDIRGIKEMLAKIFDKLEKCNRWLGFIQGVMWIKRYYTIEDMKSHTQSHKENMEDREAKGRGVTPNPKGSKRAWQL